jgi:hypothetical protein
MARQVSVLIVEDSEDDTQLLKHELSARASSRRHLRDTGPSLRAALMSRD